jgi:ATP-dependent Clp protease ATP-binding subunit ClpB
MFESLTADDALKIAKIEIDDISKRLEEKDLSIQLTEKAYEYVVKKGFDEKYGARSLKRAIQVHIEDNICDMILETPNLQGEILFDEVDGMIVGTANE